MTRGSRPPAGSAPEHQPLPSAYDELRARVVVHVIYVEQSRREARCLLRAPWRRHVFTIARTLRGVGRPRRELAKISGNRLAVIRRGPARAHRAPPGRSRRRVTAARLRARRAAPLLPGRSAASSRRHMVARSGVEAELVERAVELGGVVVDAEGAGREELVGAVAAAQEADREHLRAAGGEEIPDGVADDVAVRRARSRARRRRRGTGRAPASRARPRRGRSRPSPSGTPSAASDESISGRRPEVAMPWTMPARAAGRRAARPRPAAARRSGSSSRKIRAVARLDRLRLLSRELPPHLARDRAREQPAAHPDPAVDPPAVDRHPLLRERPLPREHMRVDRVDERSVEIEDQRLRQLVSRASPSRA